MAVKRYDGSAWQTVAGLGTQGAAATSSSIATWVKTASGGETSLSGNDDNSQALSYTVGQELVFINGTLLKRGSDYTATDGTTITGLAALAANDVATVWTVNAFSVANTYTQAQVDNAFVNKSGYFAAGKNKIINGDFAINQRSFTSTTTSGTYGLDRWNLAAVNGTTTYSAETFTPGSAPVAGYEGKNFARIVSSGQSSTDALSALQQRIENVRTFAGQTATVSFWAKAGSGTPSVAVWFQQSFGSGGSTTVIVNGTKQTISTSWARYSFTTNIPSISGKTIGTANDQLILNLTTSAGTDRNSYTDSLGIQSATIDIWGVQIESGSVATAFQTATGTLAGELAACQRYYQRISNTGGNTLYAHSGINISTTRSFHYVALPVNFRGTPSIAESGAVVGDAVGSNYDVTAISVYAIAGNSVNLDCTHNTGYIASDPVWLALPTNGYIEMSAEL